MSYNPDEFQCLLAAAVKTDKDWEKIGKHIKQYGYVIGTPKLDGIRIMKHPDGTLRTRSNKLIRNAYIQSLAHEVPDYFDGEIITYWKGDEVDEEGVPYGYPYGMMKDFNKVQSDVMNSIGEPFWKFHAFDDFTYPDDPYTKRTDRASVRALDSEDRVVFVPMTVLRSVDDVIAYADRCDAEGWEGAMIRIPTGPYNTKSKSGNRSSLTEGILQKIKKFDDDEGVIIGYKQFKSNGSKQPHPLRAAHFHALGCPDDGSEVLLPMVGALVVQWKGVVFDIGTGLSMWDRQYIWANQEDVLGRHVKFKYQGVGTLGRPRFPIFVAIRDEDDMS